MTRWDPPREWSWKGKMLGTAIVYQHRFEDHGEATTFDWIVSLYGPLARLIRPVFARVYGRNLDRAIPRLQAWIVR